MNLHTCERFGNSNIIPVFSGWLAICSISVPTGEAHTAEPEGGRGEGERHSTKMGCGFGEMQLFNFPSRKVQDCSTCFLSSAGNASNTDRST